MRCYCVVSFQMPLEAIDMPTPTPTGTEVLLQVRAAGVCHSDIHIWEGGYDLGHGRRMSLEDRGLTLPVVMGHETVGTVVSVGDQVKDISIGQNYLVYPWVACGTCDLCLEDRENECPKSSTQGIHRAGGYADHILVTNSKYLIPIGNMDPAEIAPYACSGVTTYSALQKIGPEVYQKAPIVIIGAGGLGLMTLQLLKALNGVGAIVVDIDPIKRQAALEAGALAVVDGNAPDSVAQIIQANSGQPVRAVLDLVNSEKTTAMGFDSLHKGGKMVLVGLFGGAATWPLTLFPLKIIHIMGSYVGNLKELKELVALVRDAKIKSIPVTRYKLEQADEVLHALRAGNVVGRAVLTN